MELEWNGNESSTPVRSTRCGKEFTARCARLQGHYTGGDPRADCRDSCRIGRRCLWKRRRIGGFGRNTAKPARLASARPRLDRMTQCVLTVFFRQELKQERNQEQNQEQNQRTEPSDDSIASPSCGSRSDRCRT
jgi:hypothetical protein